MKPYFHRVTCLSLCVGLWCLLLLGAIPRQGMGEPPTVAVHVQTPRVVLGGTVFALIDAPDASAVQVAVGKQTVPALPHAEGQWEAVVGVWMEEKAGPRTLTATATFPTGTANASDTFTVVARAFPVQHIRLSKSAEAKYEAPSVQEEYRLLHLVIYHEEPTRAWHGAFQVPVPGRISTRYGQQRFRNGKKVSIHKGVDIAAPYGTPVHAINAGTVTLVRKFGMHGHAVVVDHGGGVVSLYLHLSTFLVKEGDTVTAGQAIARVGATGVATGPHLHYALYVHGVAVDPTLWRQVGYE